MKNFYEDLDDFEESMENSQSPDAHLRAQERREHADDAFMDDVSTPAPDNFTPSIEHNEAEMSHTSSYASQHQSGDASASASFQVRQSMVKSESEEAVPNIAEPRYGSVQPWVQPQAQHSSGTTGAGVDSFTPPPANNHLPSPPIPYQDMSVQPPSNSPPPVEEFIQQQAPLEIANSDDDDDDIMIIDPTRAPAQVQRKWQQYQPAIREEDVFFIKSEPRDAPAPITPPPKKKPDIHSVLAQQRAMIARRGAGNGPPNGPTGSSNNAANGLPRTAGGSTSGWRENSPQAEGSGTNNKGKGKQVVQPYEELVSSDPHSVGREDPIQVDAALGVAGEDHSWMEQDDDVDEDYEEIKDSIAVLQKKQVSCPFSFRAFGQQSPFHFVLRENL